MVVMRFAIDLFQCVLYTGLPKVKHVLVRF